MPLLIAGILVAEAASTVLLLRNYAHPKQDFEGALRLIAKQREPGDVVTSLGLASEPFHNYLAPDWPVTGSEVDLVALEGRARHVWLVTAFDDHVRPEQGAALARVKQRYMLAAELEGTLGGGTVKVYRSR